MACTQRYKILIWAPARARIIFIWVQPVGAVLYGCLLYIKMKYDSSRSNLRLPAGRAQDSTIAGSARQQYSAIVHTKTGRARDCRVVGLLPYAWCVNFHILFMYIEQTYSTAPTGWSPIRARPASSRTSGA
jgi:hypothetical protein